MLTIEERDAAVVIRVRGDIDVTTAPGLAEVIGKTAEEAPDRRVVVHLGACSYFDSSGISALLRCKKRLGGRLGVVAPGGSNVRRVLEMVGLIDALLVTDTLDSAVGL